MAPDLDRTAPGWPPFLQGGGVCGALAREVDWARTPLGPVERWPQSLKTTVGTVLHSRHPMFLWWGPELIQIYNDAYLPSFGKGKHPAAMGQPGRECWQEIWPIIGPQIDDVMSRGLASWNEDQLVPIFRNGRIEDVYWTYGYSPVFDDAGHIGGTLVVCTETTGRVVAQRRLKALQAILDRTAGVADRAALLRRAGEALAPFAREVPLALFHLAEPPDGELRLSQASGMDPAAAGLTPAAERALIDRALAARGPSYLPPGEHPLGGLAGSGLYLAPLFEGGPRGGGGFVAFATSAGLPFDEPYRAFLQQIVDELGRLDTLIRNRKAEQELDRFFHLPTLLLSIAGTDGKFKRLNPAWETTLGFSVAELMERPFLEFVHPDDLQATLAEMESLGRGLRTLSFENRYRCKDGSWRWLSWTTEPVGDVWYCVTLDVTEQKRASLHVEQTQAELKAIALQRAALLAREQNLRQAAEAADRAKDEFLAMLGHELRNPLAPISTAVQLMKLRGGGSAERERQVIERQVLHLSRLVDDLLDVSRIAQGKIELERRPVELAEVASSAIELASPLLEARFHTLTVEIERGGLAVDGDPIRLAQVVANLLSNAAKYTEPRGAISIRGFREGAEVVLQVRDNGAGIAPELLPRVFDLFVQGRRTLERAEGGLGLGLTLVKNLVEMHGGTASAASAGLGLGSEFTVRLPAAHEQPAAAPPPVASVRPSGRARRVLVVDDNLDGADLLAEVLRMHGHEVEVAHDGPSALEVLTRFHAEVGLLDLGLPVMDGFELAARIRATRGTDRMRLVAITGYGQEADRERARRAGFDLHLVKPVEFDEVVAAVDGGSSPP